MKTQSGTIPKRSKNSQMLSKKSFSASKSVRKNIGGKGFGRSTSSRTHPEADLVVQKVVAAVEVGSPVDHLAVDSGGVNNGSASLV